ncbi:unnamed protein product [Acanthoscelides obtectus]|uniref:ABC transmembrane type-1 domain-containing protein n=1 Tax=Acanthoscelides obtectus TaxID=200917 RepID=A0A9P0Q6U6_ACAOB|nr:unnamed protein product [Acanthoscelides obtectus]CAK1642112.1 Multidrug resistance-associated protein 4 [Acanthoscelides obtectus]
MDDITVDQLLPAKPNSSNGLRCILFSGLTYIPQSTNITYLHNYLLHLTSMGIRIRTAFCALIYRKCLRLSPESLTTITTGNIVTLMTKDVAAFETMIMYANDVWIGCVQTVVIFYLLYRRVGVAAFVGVGLFLIMIPIQITLAKLYPSYVWNRQRILTKTTNYTRCCFFNKNYKNV